MSVSPGNAVKGSDSGAEVFVDKTPISPRREAQSSTASSISSSAADQNKGCFTKICETLQGWFYSFLLFLERITECCRSKEIISVRVLRPDGTKELVGNSQSTAIEPFNPEACEQKMTSMIQNTITQCANYYKTDNPTGFDPNKEYCVCLEFTLEAHRPNEPPVSRKGTQFIWIKDGKILENSAEQNIIQLEGNERSADRVSCEARIIMGEKFPDGTYRFYRNKQTYDSKPGSFMSTGTLERTKPLTREGALDYLKLCSRAGFFLRYIAGGYAEYTKIQECAARRQELDVEVMD